MSILDNQLLFSDKQYMWFAGDLSQLATNYFDLGTVSGAEATSDPGTGKVIRPGFWSPDKLICTVISHTVPGTAISATATLTIKLRGADASGDIYSDNTSNITYVARYLPFKTDWSVSETRLMAVALPRIFQRYLYLEYSFVSTGFIGGTYSAYVSLDSEGLTVGRSSLT